MDCQPDDARFGPPQKINVVDRRDPILVMLTSSPVAVVFREWAYRQNITVEAPSQYRLHLDHAPRVMQILGSTQHGRLPARENARYDLRSEDCRNDKQS